MVDWWSMSRARYHGFPAAAGLHSGSTRRLVEQQKFPCWTSGGHSFLSRWLWRTTALVVVCGPPQPQTQTPPPPAAAQHAANPYTYPHPYQYQQQEAKTHAYAHPTSAPPQPNPSADHGHLLLHSLLRRVAVLESALPRGFPAPPPSRRPPHPNPRPRRAARYQEEVEEEESESEPESPPPRPRRPARAGPPSAAVERAARTIQAHFRRFLARRSRTLRQLKELAVLRSKAAAIRGSLSGRRGCADPAAVSEAAMGLLLRLDAIQGGDPMIREGKRAVSRELTRILEFVDKVLVKEHEQVAMGDALGASEYHEGCSASFVGGRPSVSKKKVSFSGNGQVHELNEETGDGNEVDEGSENSSSAESDEVKPNKRSANGKPGLAAPMPVHMESRRIADARR
uniref:BAG domain-containing protein n=1 Tax=Setaria italica TaxID=4555 RepID=K3Z6S9_SETIT